LVGPVITQDAQREFLEAAAAVSARGGKLLTGGHVTGSDGWFVAPAVFTGVDLKDPLMSEEVFAPFAGLTHVKTLDEAISQANGVRYGLTASVHGRDIEAIIRAAHSLKTGMVKVNSPTAGVDFHAPFGGTKDSSYGQREQGKDALRFYTMTRTITLGSGTKAID
jgi:aldehyde dehydrogenase (NAD+)